MFYNSLFMDKQHQHLQDSSDNENDQQIETIGSKYILDPRQYLTFCQKDKKIKIMDEQNPILSNVYLKDISLHKKGPLQDKIYSKMNRYYQNIRRGNTLCQIYHKNQNNSAQQEYDLFFCRRGMKKFYDLQPDYLLVGASHSTHHRLMKARIFEQMEKELQVAGGKYHLYCLFKENGEHCQIGYIKELQSWLFASKNVAILARNTKDLQDNYHKERFYWAKLVAEQFFRVLQGFSKQQKEQFKKDIDGYTLLGEHCGNDKHQHITKYDKVQIIFYGLVKNIGTDHCQPVEKCRQFLNKYNLKMSFCKQKKNLKDKNSILSNMYQMLKEVAEGTMQKQGQGSVMYIVCERNEGSRTVGMCKLKTCEYLIYRRLREMLKLNVSKKGNTANTLQKYKFQIQQLVEHYFKPPKPVLFYYKLAEKAFEEAGSNSEVSQTYLRYKFVDFINQFEKQESQKNAVEVKQLKLAKPKRLLLVCLPRLSNTLQKFCKGNQIDFEYMYRAGKQPTKHTVHILYMIPRLGAKLQQNTELVIPHYGQQQILACIEQLKESKDLTKSQLITFVKSEDKSKSVRMLYEKIQIFKQSCRKQDIPFQQPQHLEMFLIQSIKSLISTQILPVVIKQSRKYVVLPLLIPGSGKSSLASALKRSSTCSWKVIESDQIRRQIMQKTGEVDLDTEQSNEIFYQAKKQTQKKMNELISRQILALKQGKQYLYIDKLLSPFNIEQAIQSIIEIDDSVRILIVTQEYSPIRLNDAVYPFSLNYLTTCLKRCLERQQHKTMATNPYEVAKIVLKFYQMGLNFNQKHVIKLSPQKIKFANLPFVEHSENSIYINQNLRKKVESCLKNIEPGKQAKDSSDFIQLVEYLYKYAGQKQQSEPPMKYTKMGEQLQKHLENYSK